jgi:Sap-like sulfolipid-1-addressing protein
VLTALAVVLPLGLGGAVSPVMLTEQTVLLAGPGGLRAGTRYAAGVLGTLLVIVGALVLFGRAISLPTQPRLDASLDLVVGGVLLVVVAAVVGLGRRRHPPPHARRRRGSLTSRAALPFGVFSMATNLTTLALVVPAAKEISSAEGAFAGRLVLIVVLVGLAGIPAWAPVFLTRAAPDAGHRALAAVGDWIERRGHDAIVVLLIAASLFFLARGTIRLVQ